MNILITNDDGYGTPGHEVLQRAVDKTWPGATVIGLFPKTGMSGASMALKGLGAEGPGNLRKYKVKGEQSWEMAATPVELMYYAFLRSEEFLPRGVSFDVVFSGVNHGANVGLNVFHSGTVGAALFAARAFGVKAVAFSQELGSVEDTILGKAEASAFANTEKYLPSFLSSFFDRVMPGECYNINIPLVVKGSEYPSRVANYNPFFWTPGESASAQPGLERYRQTRGGLEDDVKVLQRGCISVSDLRLEVNAPTKY